MSTFSRFLFARPSFIEGASRSVDLFGVFSEYNSSPSTELADYFAIYADWATVAGDIQGAMKEFRREQESAAETSRSAGN